MNKLFVVAGLGLLLTACAAASPDMDLGEGAPLPQSMQDAPRPTFTPLTTPSIESAEAATPGVGTPSNLRPRDGAITSSPSDTPTSEADQPVDRMTSTVTVTPGLPRVFAFGLEPPEVEPGGRVYLSWDAHGERAYICPSTFLGTIDHLCFDVVLKGEQYITIFADEQAWDYRGFELHVWQGTVEEVAFLPLRIACQGGGQWWFFKGDPFTTNIPANCPINPAVLSNGAAQRFEHGMMLWVEVVGRVIVLYDDNHYENYADLDCPPPEDAVSPSPPPNRYVPISGFGNLWHGNCPGTDHIQRSLGWATAPEFFTTTAYQCFEDTEGLTCFVRGPEVQIYRLQPDIRWDVWPTN